MKSLSLVQLCERMDCSLPGSSIHGILQARSGMGCHALLQGIFLTQGSNQRLLSLLLWQAGFSTAITTWEPINVYIICHFLETFIERSKSFPSLPYPLNSLPPTHELSSQMLIPSLGGELPIFSSHHHSCFKMQRIYPLSKTNHSPPYPERKGNGRHTKRVDKFVYACCRHGGFFFPPPWNNLKFL